MAPGDTLRLVAEALDANGYRILRLANAFAWTSSDAAVARVEERSGLVTGESEGTAVFTASTGSVQASATITVVNLDRAVLLALYEATGGPNWSRSDNWLTDAPLGEWYGVRADDYGRVVSLYPWNPAMSGPIPPELGDLTRLEHLILQRTSLSGSVPAELGRLKNLKTLRLSGSLLTGPIPSELGALSALRTLDLGYNDLTGSIPAELGNLAALRILYLAGNRLSGEIPDELGNFASLIDLQLQDNDLAGHLPATLGDLGELHNLFVNGNPLTGALPATVRRLGNLRTLVAHDTELCAPRPLWNWGYSSIEVFRVPQPCPDGTGTAYLVQSVQDLNESVPLVAGRDALLRVLLTAPVRNGERVPVPPVQARFYANGREIYLAEISGKAGPLPTDIAIAEGDLEASANVRIPGHVIRPGLLEFRVQVDPAGTLDPWFGIVRALPEVNRSEVLDPPAMELTIVPFLWTGDPDSSIIDITRAMAADPDNHEKLSLTREVLPISDWRVRAHEPVWTDSRDAWDLMNRARAIRALEGGRGYWMATMENNLPATIAGVAYVPGWASFSRPSSSTIAHELGHNMSLRHAPCNSPPNPDLAYPYPGGTIGMWGYSARHEELVSPEASDLMGYCWNRWISDYHFRKALAHRLRVETLATAPFRGPTRTLMLWGGTNAATGPYLEPAFVVDAVPVLPDSAGGYTLTGRDAGGRELFSVAFAMPEIADAEEEAGGFAYTLPVRPGWEALASVTLSAPDGRTAMLDGTTDRPMTIVRDAATGRVRAFLDGVDSAAQADAGGPALAVVSGAVAITSRGIPDARSWRR